MRREDLLAQCANIVAVPLEKSALNHTISENNHSGLQCEQIWKIIPNTTPKIIKRCTRCSSSKFVSSDKFRVNASKKVIDVWLIYKCDQCEVTLKVPIISRMTVSRINRDLLSKFHDNDRGLAWQFAFNICRQQKDLELDWSIGFDVLVRTEGIKKPEASQSNLINVLITSGFFLKIALFSVLRQKLECSRSQLEKLHTRGMLGAYSLQGQAIKLKAAVGSGCLLTLSPEITVVPSLALVKEGD